MTTGGSAERIPAPLRTEALEQLLTERGLIDPIAMDAIITNYETNVGPLNGAKVVAKAWTDPEYRRWLLDDGTAAIKELGFIGRQGEHIVVVENTATSPQRGGLHAVLVLPVVGARPAAELVQGPGLPRAGGQGAAQGAFRDGASNSPTTCRSPSTTPAARCAGWCCPNARPAPRACPRNSSCR